MIAADAAIEDGKSWDGKVLWIGIGAGMLATIGYLAQSSASQSTAERPLIHFYVLATIAFFAWALATSEPARDVVGVSAGLAEFIIAVVILLVPVADWALKPVVVKLDAWIKSRSK